MSSANTSSFHTVEDEWLAAYCAGGLSMAKRLVLNCQAAINPALVGRINTFDGVGGAILESAKGEAVSDGFMDSVFGRLDTPQTEIALMTEPKQHKTTTPDWMPGPLADFFQKSNMTAKWKNMGFGMARISLHDEDGEKLYLLKSRPGLKMPHHAHKGEEWALILQGGYHVGEEGFAYGDLHREDETVAHQPIVDNHGEACITLVASEGGLKFTNPALNLFRPLLGV